MRVEACDELVVPSDLDIRDAVQDMLLACDISEPPTPIDRLLAFRKLNAEERADLVPGPLTKFFRTKGISFWRSMTGRIRGLLDLESRQITIDPHLHHHRRDFLVFHEIAHEMLVWHRELFVVTAEWHLHPRIRTTFEAEANYFAGHAIFQLNDMSRVQRGRRLRIADLAGLAARYGASLTATARQYIIVQDLPVALFVGRPVGKSPQRSIVFSYAIGNTAFIREFGQDVWGEGLPEADGACRVLNVPGCSTSGDEITLSDVRGETRRVSVETLFNTYNTLTLVHPLARTRRVLGWRRHGELKVN